MRVRFRLACSLAGLLAILGASCGTTGASGSGDGVFFPTLSGEGARPAAIVAGVLVERDGCLFIRGHGEDVLALWEEGYAYSAGEILDASGETVVRVGEELHGGGGYGSDWRYAEEHTRSSIPGRCRPGGAEPFATIYDVRPGPPPA